MLIFPDERVDCKHAVLSLFCQSVVDLSKKYSDR